MKILKKDDGHTLVEMMLVVGLMGMFLLLLWTNYLSIHRTYIKVSKKAQNLEEARIVVNFITDTFRKYEAWECKIIIQETGQELKDNEKGTVKEVIFKDSGREGSEIIVIKYDEKNKKATFQTQEIGNQIYDFTVKRSGELLDFIIRMGKEGNGVIPDQMIKVATTVSLQYTERLYE